VSQLSVGEDLFSTIAAVGLISIFVSVLAQVYNQNDARIESQKEFDITLDVAEQLKSYVLCESSSSGQLGLVSQTKFETSLPRFLELMLKRGVKIKAELVSLDGRLIACSGPTITRDSSSVSLPVVLSHSDGTREVCRLNVTAWRK